MPAHSNNHGNQMPILSTGYTSTYLKIKSECFIRVGLSQQQGSHVDAQNQAISVWTKVCFGWAPTLRSV